MPNYRKMKDYYGSNIPMEYGDNGMMRLNCEQPNETNAIANKSYVDSNMGYHGEKQIKILPSDFIGNDDSTYSVGIEDDGSAYGVRVKSSESELFCTVNIPARHKATEVMIYGNSTDSITVYEGDLSDGSYTSKGTGNTGTKIDITDVFHSTTNYLSILIAVNSTLDIIYGGYVTLEGTYQ